MLNLDFFFGSWLDQISLKWMNRWIIGKFWTNSTMMLICQCFRMQNLHFWSQFCLYLVQDLPICLKMGLFDDKSSRRGRFFKPWLTFPFGPLLVVNRSQDQSVVQDRPPIHQYFFARVFSKKCLPWNSSDCSKLNKLVLKICPYDIIV